MDKLRILGAALALAASPAFGGEATCNCDHSHTHIDWQAQWYAGGALTQAEFADWNLFDTFDSASYTSASSDEQEAGYRVFVGVDLLTYFAIEMGYADLGEASFAAESDGSGTFWNAGPVRESVELAGYDLSVLGKLPLLQGFALVAQVGMQDAEAEVRASGSRQASGPFVFENSDGGAEWLYGGRLEYDGVPSLRLSAAYLYAKFDSAFGFGAPEYEALSLSAAYRF